MLPWLGPFLSLPALHDLDEPLAYASASRESRAAIIACPPVYVVGELQTGGFLLRKRTSEWEKISHRMGICKRPSFADVSHQ